MSTLPQATAAGFWYLHENQPIQATKAFSVVRPILYGEEMYQLAASLSHCQQAQDPEAIETTNLPIFQAEALLRPTIWQAIHAFDRVIQDTKLVRHSVGKATRSLALNRAIGELTQIIQTKDNLPDAERDLVVEIAETWRTALEPLALDIGQAEITAPVRNPYTVGDPVLGSRFAGRDDIMRQLEELWITGSTLQSIVLYGHRRMGKTSILRNATNRIGSQSKIIYINLQRLGNVENGVGEVLLALSDEIGEATGVTPPKDEEFLQLPQRTFERYLKAVLRSLEGPLTPNSGGTGESRTESSSPLTSRNSDLESRSPKYGLRPRSAKGGRGASSSNGLIIALDEFETLEALIQQGQLSKQFLGYLRGLVQMNPRLAFAFAGLHTLEEMTADYFQPFFASVIPIRVGFLNRAATLQLLATPSDDFPLDYQPEALEEIYALTHGQPYLCQLIGFQLVRRYNDYVFEQGRQRDNLLTIEDVDAVITQQFFQLGRYYFDGVWGQAGQGAPGQQAILQALTAAPLTTAELQAQLSLDTAILQTALATLQKHDVVEEVDNEGRWQITVALLKTWLTHYRDR